MQYEINQLQESVNHMLNCLYEAKTENEKVYFYSEYKRLKKLYDEKMDEFADWLRYDAI